jgi:hypothetical protein
VALKEINFADTWQSDRKLQTEQIYFAGKYLEKSINLLSSLASDLKT